MAETNVSLYTFRTFPSELLTQIHGNVFTFGKLRSDLEKFTSLAPANRSHHVIGFALSTSSRQETVALNKFNKGLIDKHGLTARKLNTLPDSPFVNALIPTHSFCNWTMYTLSAMYEVSFFHIKKEDFAVFSEWLHKLLD